MRKNVKLSFRDLRDSQSSGLYPLDNMGKNNLVKNRSKAESQAVHKTPILEVIVTKNIRSILNTCECLFFFQTAAKNLWYCWTASNKLSQQDSEEIEKFWNL